MIIFLKGVFLITLGYAMSSIIVYNLGWLIVRKYYSMKKYNDKIAIIKTDSLIAYSYAIVELDKKGYKLKFDRVIPFNFQKYRAILINFDCKNSNN